MWQPGAPAAQQCEGCTWCATQVAELSYLHSRDITYAVFCQGPWEESIRYHDFMGWNMPWYSAEDSRDALLSPPRVPGMMHLVCYLRDGDRVFETYWTTLRGVEQMDNSYALMDLTVHSTEEAWGIHRLPGRSSAPTPAPAAARPPGRPPARVGQPGRPIPQWPRLEAGPFDNLKARGPDPEPGVPLRNPRTLRRCWRSPA